MNHFSFKLYAIVVIWMLYPITTFAQMDVDSITSILNREMDDSTRYELYIEKISLLKTSDPSMGIRILNRFDPEVIKNNHPELLAWYHYHLGELYYNNNQPDSSELLLQLAYDLADTNNNPSLKGNVLIKLSDLYAYYNDIDKKTQMSLEAQKIFESLKDTSGYIRASKQVANSMTKLGRSIEAIQLNITLLDYAIDPLDRANIYNSLSIAYENLEKYDSAYFYQIAYRDEVDRTENLANRFIAYYNLALTEQNLGRLEKAELTFDQAMELARASNVPVLLPYGLISKAGLMTTMKRYREATRLFDEASTLKLIPDQKKLLYQGYYENFKQQGRYRDALIHIEKWKQVSDSLSNVEIMNKTNELQIQYETEKKENEINRLSYEKQIEENKVKTQRHVLIGLGLVLLLLSGLLFYIFRQKKKIQDKNIIIHKALKEKEALVQEIHHRVKNNLQVISSLLSLQSRSTEETSAIHALEEGQHRVQSMALIHEHLYKGDHITSVGMKTYLSNMCQHIFSAHQTGKEKAHLTLEIEDIALDVSTVVPLGLILNELITNSCKYAFPDDYKGQLTVGLKERDGVLIASVSDNGIGKHPQTGKSGFGSKLIGIFAKKLDAQIEEINDNGTTTIIRIRSFKRA